MASPLDLDQLRTFVAIVDTGSFTRAAEEVFKTQSAVSMQVRRLEERLGADLFERNGRAVKMTEAGARLLTYARRMLSLSQETLLAFDEETIEGTVRIGLPDDYAERFLPEIMARFLIDQIDKNHLDLALVTKTSATSEVVRTEPLHFVTSASHSVHEEPIVPLAIGRSDCCWRRECINALQRAGRAHRVLFTSWSAQIVTSAVMAGLAVSVLPECALRPGMRVLDETDGFPRLPDAEIALMRGRHSQSPAVTALMQHIRECVQNLPTTPPAAITTRIPETRMIRSQRLRPGVGLAGW